jgi:hypothetical protein
MRPAPTKPTGPAATAPATAPTAASVTRSCAVAAEVEATTAVATRASPPSAFMFSSLQVCRLASSTEDFAVFGTPALSPSRTLARAYVVRKVQAGYKAEPLSAFLGQPAPTAPPAVDFIKPLTPAEEKTSLEFFNILNFTLQFCPTDPSETELMASFAKIGVGAGKTFDASRLSPEIKTAVEQGMADAWVDFANLRKQIDVGKVISGDLFGTRAYLKNNYLYRMAGTVLGIGGNSVQEAMYPIYAIDAAGQKLDGANRYTVHFPSGQLPPVNAFWSLTMYELPASLLVANPINRYLLNSPMLPQFVKDADGGLTFYVQNESPVRTRSRTGCPHPRVPSSLQCASTGQSKQR